MNHTLESDPAGGDIQMIPIATRYKIAAASCRRWGISYRRLTWIRFRGPSYDSTSRRTHESILR